MVNPPQRRPREAGRALRAGNFEAMLDVLGNLERTHTCGELRESDVGKQVVLMGWVAIISSVLRSQLYGSIPCILQVPSKE